jgi:hypothetical protein
MPGEEIPELKLLAGEARWIKEVDRPLVTDDDFSRAIARLRYRAKEEFAPLARNALQQFAQANAGQFPSDVSQLQPFFPSPIDGAILQRYEIVPANSLYQKFAGSGTDPVITEKVPVNAELDKSRLAIGLNGSDNCGWNTVK